MKVVVEEYEAPVVVTFGEIDFEPMEIICTTTVTCTGDIGSCSVSVTAI